MTRKRKSGHQRLCLAWFRSHLTQCLTSMVICWLRHLGLAIQMTKRRKSRHQLMCFQWFWSRFTHRLTEEVVCEFVVLLFGFGWRRDVNRGSSGCVISNDFQVTWRIAWQACLFYLQTQRDLPCRLRCLTLGPRRCSVHCGRFDPPLLAIQTGILKHWVEKLRRWIHIRLIQVFFVFAWRQIVLDNGDTSAFHSYRTEGWICRVINHQKSERFCACRWVVMLWSRWNNGLSPGVSLGNRQKYASRANLSIHFFVNLNYFVPISVTYRI